MSWFRVVFSIALVPFLLVAAEGKGKYREYTVSIPNVQLAPGEVVVSFEIDITAGAIASVSEIPVGWYLNLDNDASWQTTVKANTQVGAASLSSKDLRELHFVVRKNEFGDLKFNLAGVVSVTKDYQKEKHLKLQMTDFTVTPKP